MEDPTNAKVGTRKRTKKKEACWVARVPIATCKGSYRNLEVAQDLQRQLYNHLLALGIKAIKRVRCRTPVDEKDLIRGIKDKPIRGMCWRKLHEDCGFSQEILADVAKKFYKSHGQIDSVSAQIVSETVFDVLTKYATYQIGKPRCKKRGKVNALQSKQAKGVIVLSKDLSSVMFHKKHYPLLWDDADLYHRTARKQINEGLLTKCFLNDYELKGRKFYEIQLIFSGLPPPPQKPITITEGVGGIDPSIASLVAVRADATKGIQLNYVPRGAEKETAKLQRKLERQKKANNPLHQLTQQDPAWKEVEKEDWIETHGITKTRQQLREAHRKATAQQEQNIVAGAKQLLLLGNQWFVEQHGMKWWQQGWFGRSVQRHAPKKWLKGMLRIVEKTGGTIIWVPAHLAKLSQVDLWGPPVKKPLSQRYHIVHFPLGDELQQRDVFSAWLATLWDESTVSLDLVAGKIRYQAVGPRLYDIWAEIYQEAVKAGRKTHTLGNPFNEIAVVRFSGRPSKGQGRPTSPPQVSGNLPGCPAL